MNKGEIYKKHIRGSRYIFSNNQLAYSFPNSQKIFSSTDCSDLFQDFIDIRGEISGRVIINERRDIVTYKKEAGSKYVPYYVGRLTKELHFKGIDNNPKNLKPGLVWTGFANHHGSKFIFKKKGTIIFKEPFKEKEYAVIHVEKEFIERLKFYKIDSGKIYINENKQVWAPVQRININQFYIDTIINKNEINNQLPLMSKEQKFSLDQYAKYTNNGNDIWLPIYIGKYDELLEIDRKDSPYIISYEEMLKLF
jgi:hypothetical protein